MAKTGKDIMREYGNQVASFTQSNFITLEELIDEVVRAERIEGYDKGWTDCQAAFNKKGKYL